MTCALVKVPKVVERLSQKETIETRRDLRDAMSTFLGQCIDLLFDSFNVEPAPELVEVRVGAMGFQELKVYFLRRKDHRFRRFLGVVF